MTLSRKLITLVRSRDVNAADLQQAALITLDAVANALAGRKTDPGQILMQWPRVSAFGQKRT